MSTGACIKRQRTNARELQKNPGGLASYPNCLNCRQGRAIFEGDRQGVIELKLCGSRQQDDVLAALKKDAMADGHTLESHCKIIVMAEILTRHPELMD
jgi:hypothetical protein